MIEETISNLQDILQTYIHALYPEAVQRIQDTIDDLEELSDQT